MSLGTVPDFAFQGKGVRLDGTTPGSPAAVAGLQSGDVVIRIGGQNESAADALEIRLGRSASLLVRLTDSAGAPVAGGKVTLPVRLCPTKNRTQPLQDPF